MFFVAAKINAKGIEKATRYLMLTFQTLSITS
jgi:hypothetical protein